MRILWLLLCLALPVRAFACMVQALETVPLTVNGTVLTVPVEVNGLQANFILDTGAQRSVVAEDSIKRLDLARDPWVGTTMRGIGGLNSRPNADPRSLRLGRVPLVRNTVNRDTSLTVMPLNLGAVEGLLGRDYLSRFDLDIDMPGRRLTLYAVQQCSGRFLPWDGPYFGTAFDSMAAQAVMLPVTLDGVVLRGLLDTGASNSLLAAPGMFRMGLDVQALAADPAGTVQGVGPHRVVMRRHAFQTLTVAGQTLIHPDILVEPIRLSPIADLLIGADWLQGRRIWLSFATRQLFVTNVSAR